MLTKEQASELAHDLTVARWSKPVAIGDGYTVRAKLEYDQDAQLEEDGDWFGSIHCARDSRQRPAECDGSARKLPTRDGATWWQPPKDVVSDPTSLAKLEGRVRGYFLGEWAYVGLIVEVTAPPCDKCGERKSDMASVWAIESDAGEYFAEVILDLVLEAVSTQG
jgi:hypothetical protein